MILPALPYGRQWIEDEDIQAVIDVLQSDRITTGPAVQKFEEALAAYCGATYAVAVSSGTAALHLACLAAGLGPNQELLLSPNSFVASANCALYCGARPQFIDINPQTYNLNPVELASYLSKKKVSGAVLPVHFSGQPCNMEPIARLAQNHGLTVIEDACHALGASWQDRSGNWHRVGSCSHSDMAIFSFHPVKHITTGEGGAILTNDEKLYRCLKTLRTHGVTKHPEDLEQNDGPWYYEMHSLGYNYRITDIQCALGLAQLSKIDAWVARRRQIAQMYNQAFEGLESMIAPYQLANTRSSFHLYVLQVEGEEAAQNRKDVFEALQAQGLGVQVHYIPIHLQPYYQKHLGYSPGDFPHAEHYYNRCLSLPMFPKMSDVDVERVIDAVYQTVVGLQPVV